MTRTSRERWIGILTVLAIFVVCYALAYELHRYGIALDYSWLWTGYAIFMAALLVRGMFRFGLPPFQPSGGPVMPTSGRTDRKSRCDADEIVRLDSTGIRRTETAERAPGAEPATADESIPADNRYASASGILTPTQNPMPGTQ